MKHWLLAALCLLLIHSQLMADNYDQLVQFQKAQQPEKALGLLAATPFSERTGSDFFNLGTLYAQKEQWGLAFINFRRAQLAGFDSEPINESIRFIEAQSKLTMPPLNWGERLAFTWHAKHWWWLFYLGTILLCITNLFKSRIFSRALYQSIHLCLIVTLLTATVALVMQRRFLLTGLTTHQIALMNAPYDGAPIITELAPATALKGFKQFNNFYQVELMDGQSGWLPQDSCEPLIIKEKDSL